jgi:hypothetical protein
MLMNAIHAITSTRRTPTKSEMVGDTKKEAPELMMIGRLLSLWERYRVGNEGAAE